MTGKQNSKGFILVFLGMLSAFGPFGYVPAYFTGNVGFLPNHIFKSAVGAYYKYGRLSDRPADFWSVK